MADVVADGFLREWHRVVAEKDRDALLGLLASDVSIGAPPYWSRIGEREVVHHLLGLILDTIDGFTYRREWIRGRELALEFTGRVGTLELQGIDLLTLDDSGRVTRLDVLMRPVTGILALRDVVAPRMTAYLAEREAS